MTPRAIVPAAHRRASFLTQTTIHNPPHLATDYLRKMAFDLVTRRAGNALRVRVRRLLAVFALMVTPIAIPIPRNRNAHQRHRDTRV